MISIERAVVKFRKLHYLHDSHFGYIALYHLDLFIVFISMRRPGFIFSCVDQPYKKILGNDKLVTSWTSTLPHETAICKPYNYS